MRELFLLLLYVTLCAQQVLINGRQRLAGENQFADPFPPARAMPYNEFSDTSGGQAYKQFTNYGGGNLVAFGAAMGDSMITDNMRSTGLLINLHHLFPFYGGRYNYTMISTNGYISFAYYTGDQASMKVGLENDWPKDSDPALIAPYLCKQRIEGTASNVSYRVESRSQSSHRIQNQGYGEPRPACPGKRSPYVKCDAQSDQFLDAMQKALQEGVVGASTFRAESALVVTWRNMRPGFGSEYTHATYQLVWLTDAQGLLSYTMINYEKLGFDAADLNGNSRTGRCQAVFNGGNHTGTVPVDLSEETKLTPSSLARRSAVPHVAHGRYVHRVDDVVRPAGCSNKTGGSAPLMIYPNIVSMLGQTTVDINGLCLDPTVTYVLMIDQRQTAPCVVLNPAIARCTLPKVLDWGTKTVYFQPQSGLSHDEKAYVGFIYFVPPTIDPNRLDIGDLHAWYLNPVQPEARLKWFPRNFTTQLQLEETRNYFDPNIYNVQLGLYVVGYKESQDHDLKKFVPKHRVLCRLATFQNSPAEEHRWHPQVEKFSTDTVAEWFLTEEERHGELFSYRFGYFKLAPIRGNIEPVNKDGPEQDIPDTELPEGLVSSPISLHWLWTVDDREGQGLYKGGANNKQNKVDHVKDQARQMCADWFAEDGALDNFIRATESNSSCPCQESQAKMDLGRFMPHPRCSTLFRDVTCTETLGAHNCYMSAQNVHGSNYKRTHDGVEESSFNTHYGQTCCYDANGNLMQSTYQPVVKIDDSTPYSPGFPTRAYEFGTYPYQGMFEVPGLSSFHHDIMPYYLCCKFTDFRCQMFYWRRPSSACQAYEPPVTGSMMGTGVISTLSGDSFIYNDPGIYTLLHAHKTASTPDVQIQVRMERFPDRSVDFGDGNLPQSLLVQPSNTTVVTGVVLSSSDSDRVHVLLRKDTRRGRYRTSIIVGNVIRYFDDMHLQRFRGVTVYVNSVVRGQGEIYVVLDKAQIGVKIRESYGMDMDRKMSYFESMGLLDLEVSVPPQYNANKRPGEYSGLDNHARIYGLLNPENSPGFSHGGPIPWERVNQNGDNLEKYKVKSEYKMNDQPLSMSRDDDVVDLFNSRSDDEALYEAFADHQLKGPVFKTSSRFYQNPFHRVQKQEIDNFIQFCKTSVEPEDLPRYLQAAHKRCPSDMGALEADCNGDATCLYNAIELQARLLGDEARIAYNQYTSHMYAAVRKYNSCGAMNIEYPEYLIKGPSSAERAYLVGDRLSFSCFQTHVLYGDSEFTCNEVSVPGRENEKRLQWTQGGQPWCRHRAKDAMLTWLQWTAIVVGGIIAVMFVFAFCWSLKHRDRARRRESPRGEDAPLQTVPPRKNSWTRVLDAEPIRGSPQSARYRMDSPAVSDPIPLLHKRDNYMHGTGV